MNIELIKISGHLWKYVDSRANGQFPKLANAIWGKDSYVPGIKKVVGGLLAADITHSKCGQKMLCDEMASEVNVMSYAYT